MRRVSSAQKGLNKKGGTQRGKYWQANEVAGNKTTQKAEKMGAEICSFSAGTEKGKEG